MQLTKTVFLIFVIFGLSNLPFDSSASAQVIDKFAQQFDHEFTNSAGEVVASGTFVKAEGGKIEVRGVTPNDRGAGAPLRLDFNSPPNTPNH